MMIKLFSYQSYVVIYKNTILNIAIRSSTTGIKMWTNFVHYVCKCFGPMLINKL